jgi:hypothetical protein
MVLKMITTKQEKKALHVLKSNIQSVKITWRYYTKMYEETGKKRYKERADNYLTELMTLEDTYNLFTDFEYCNKVAKIYEENL